MFLGAALTLLCSSPRALRAADAFQLAAALVWCKERPNRRLFVSFDNALADAAEAEGFDVHRLLAR